MRLLVKKSPLSSSPLLGMPILTPIVGLIVDKRLNPKLPDKYIDPTPEFWGEELKEDEVILRVPMKQWKGEIIFAYVSDFMKREGITGNLKYSLQ